jgi:hypothetical protein
MSLTQTEKDEGNVTHHNRIDAPLQLQRRTEKQLNNDQVQYLVRLLLPR